MIRRLARGCLSALGMLVFPVGRLCGGLLRKLTGPERQERGLILILPGIEGESFLNHSIAWGLADAGVPAAIEIHDWTTGHVLLFAYHLRSWWRNLRRAQRVVERIVAYQTAYPGRPVHLIGHSGGGAIALLTLEALPPDCRISSAILLGPAISPDFNLVGALRHTDCGIWNFCSRLDFFFLGAATWLLGTVDGRHTVSAGMCGFRVPADLAPEERDLYETQLHQRPYRGRMAASFNLGGHFGGTNRVFAAEWLAPLLGIAN